MCDLKVFVDNIADALHEAAEDIVTQPVGRNEQTTFDTHLPMARCIEPTALGFPDIGDRDTKSVEQMQQESRPQAAHSAPLKRPKCSVRDRRARKQKNIVLLLILLTVCFVNKFCVKVITLDEVKNWLVATGERIIDLSSNDVDAVAERTFAESLAAPIAPNTIDHNESIRMHEEKRRPAAVRTSKPANSQAPIARIPVHTGKSWPPTRIVKVKRVRVRSAEIHEKYTKNEKMSKKYGRKSQPKKYRH